MNGNAVAVEIATFSSRAVRHHCLIIMEMMTTTKFGGRKSTYTPYTPYTKKLLPIPFNIIFIRYTKV